MNDTCYNPKIIESIVQKHWIKKKTFSVKKDTNKEKFYCLPMLPYPSGRLHMGHVRNYTISDVISRYQRMLGKNVLHPIGWDAFGLPAEETAIKNNISPKKWTYANISIMKKQLIKLGFSYDWKREITTCKPEYYHWEQLFFIKLFKKKLVYKKKTLVNWCEVDQTVLANEQAQNGLCWRCGSRVKLKKISQWFIKIKSYANRLLKDLKLLCDWPKKVLTMQKNWIGKSRGIKISCIIYNTNHILKIYTTKPETIMGATFFTISIHHKLISYLIKKNTKINKFFKKNINILYSKFQKNKKIIGINTKFFVLHPITQEKLPLWITNYIKHDYATGATIAVPCNNKTDYHFSKLYNLPIKNIFFNIEKNKKKEKKIILINCMQFNGLTIKKARKKITNFLIKKKVAKNHKYYKIQDWCISRQRYWGTPIPVAYDNKGNIFPIPKKNLPVVFPKHIKKNEHISSLLKNKTWIKTKINNIHVTRETDTFDTFIESSWYYARYTNPNYKKDILDIKSAQYWLPVDQYIGGIEHAVMHLIYFRFYHKLLYDFGYVHSLEPVKKLICQGMVVTDSFFKFNNDGSKQWLQPSQLKINRNIHGKIIRISKKDCSEKIIYAGKIKMSKSKNNGVNPEDIIKKYGADTLRLFLMFAAPINASLEWNSTSIIGMYRFLTKIWTFIHTYSIQRTLELNQRNKINQKKILAQLYNTISKVTVDIEKRYSFNTAIATIIKFFNYIVKLHNKKKIDEKNLQKCLSIIIKMLYPFTPHICFFLWKTIHGQKNDIDTEKWPKTNQNAVIQKKFILVIQINGKKRNIVKINSKLKKEQIIALILKKEETKKYFNNATIKKIIYIPEKIINFVLISKTEKI